MNKKLKSLFSFSLLVATTFYNINTAVLAANITADGTTVNTAEGESPYGTITITNSGKVANSLDIEADTLTTYEVEDYFQNSGSASVNSLTNNGVVEGFGGVNGDFIIKTNGTNNGKITQGNITLGSTGTTSAVENNGTITSSGAFTNYSTVSGNNGTLNITSGTNAEGNITQGSVNITGAYTNNAPLTVTTKTTNSGAITNNNSIYTENLINTGTIDGDSGNLTINNGGSSSGSIIQNNITVGGSFKNNANMEAKSNFINSGTLENHSSITAGTLQNNGTIAGTDGSLSIAGEGSSYGSISQKNISLGGNFSNNGSLEATNELVNAGNLQNASNIKVGKLSNTGSIVGDSGSLTVNNGGSSSSSSSIVQNDIKIKGTFENAGIIEAKNSLTTAGTITNSNIITTNTLSNTGTIKGAQGSIVVNNGGTNSGTINQQNITFGGNKLTNSGSITSTGTFTNNSTIEGNGNLYINGGGISNEIIKQKNITFNGAGKTFANNSSMTVSETLTNSGVAITNNSSITTSRLTNSTTGTIDGTGNLTINTSGYNYGTIKQNQVTLNGSYTNYGTGKISAPTITFGSNANLTNQGTFADTSATLTTRGTINNSGEFGNNNATITNYANVTNSKNFTGKTLNNTASGIINNSGTLNIETSVTNAGSITNSKNITTGTFTNNGIFTNNGASATLNSTTFTNNKNFILDNGAKASINKITNNASSGVITIRNGSSLVLNNQTSAINGTINTEIGNNTMNLGNGIGANGVVNIGNGLDNTTLNLTGGNITDNAILNVKENSHLIINNAQSNVTLTEQDTYNGGITLKDGKLNLSNQTVNATSNPTGNSPFYNQSGGALSLKNSSITIADGNAITGGDIELDSLSVFSANDGGFYLNNFKSSGQLNAMNIKNQDFVVKNLIIGDAATGDDTLDITIDVYGRSNADGQNGFDRFLAENIKEDTGLTSATINVKDWGLSGDIMGLDAPIDRNINLTNLFGGNISENININIAEKEFFTPIGWYTLRNNGGMAGNYSLSLSRFNPAVYRGQVTSVAQHMNQLAINDMLFNHTMLLPSMKEDNSRVIEYEDDSCDPKYPKYAPYQYSLKDGGLWYKMYGIFEKLQMDKGFKVGNNAYGALIGADFKLKELRNDWYFLPTVYLGYNGAHQTYKGNGAYQNGAQTGFMGTWFKDNIVIGGLVYGGVYNNDMDSAAYSDNAFNYFVGTAAKSAYNLRLNENWVIQPNLVLAYNMFGQQNWHTSYGEMGMMSGFLNGFNAAPGVNFIWEKETFNLYATIQYMFNICGDCDGRAGNVGLPNLSMDRGYLQYGLGINKSLTNRSSGYFQTLMRNVGRTGVGFQLGFKYLLGE